MSGRRLLSVLFPVLLAAAFVPRVLFVLRTSPYPLQEDEALIAVPAARMLERGTLDPAYFKYPSLPIYLAAAGLWAGRAIDGDTAAPIGNVGRPHYTRPRVMETARILFALVSVVALGLAGVVGRRAFGEPVLLVLAPLLLLVSDRFLLQSWMYLNVDIVGAAVCTGAVALLFATRDREGLLHRAILPGLVTGFAVGSKYYLGLVGLPFALVLFERRHRKALARNLVAIVLFTAAGFLLTTPYALVDRGTFVEQVLFEVEHYQEGHAGGEGEPGLAQLAYYAGQVVREFGWGIAILALVGVGEMFRRDRRTAWHFLAFPVVLLAFLCLQRVHFPRNLTSFYVLVAVAAALGTLASARGLARLASREGPGRGALLLGAGAAAALVLATVPWKRLAAGYGVPVDSRTRAARWIAAERPAGARVYVAEELQMDLASLTEYRVTSAPLVELVRPGMSREYGGEDPVFVLPEIVPGTRFAKTYGKAMQPADELELRARFGRNVPPRLTTRLMHMGDPRLEVLELPGPSAGRGDRGPR